MKLEIMSWLEKGHLGAAKPLSVSGVSPLSSREFQDLLSQKLRRLAHQDRVYKRILAYTIGRIVSFLSPALSAKSNLWKQNLMRRSSGD